MIFGHAGRAGSDGACVYLAVGTMGGILWLWRLQLPGSYTPPASAPDPEMKLVSGPQDLFSMTDVQNGLHGRWVRAQLELR